MLTLTGKCTTCKKTWELNQSQMDEARDMGCAFSPCCQAVATIERGRANDEPLRERGHWRQCQAARPTESRPAKVPVTER